MDIVCGSDHNLCIDENHKIYSWGRNDSGQCGYGHGQTESKVIPSLINKLIKYNIINIKCGAYHSYALNDKNEHYLFGSNGYNQCSIQNFQRQYLCYLNES